MPEGASRVRLRWQAALERIPQMRSLPDPQLGYRFDTMSGGFGSWQHRLEVSQMFPWFGKRDLMGVQAGFMADIEEQMYREMKLRLDTMVTEVYTEYYFLSREIIVTGENLKLLTYLERVAQARYTAGKGNQSDVIKAQVEMGVLEERIQSLRDMFRPTAANSMPFSTVPAMLRSLPRPDFRMWRLPVTRRDWHHGLKRTILR